MQYNTKSKQVIKDFLSKDSDRFFSAEQIAENAGKDMKISTVYRILSEFCESGLVVKEYSEELSSNIYKINKHECHKHYHLQCIGCGKLVHIEDAETQELIEQIGEKNNFIINKEKTVIYGVCDQCKDK